MSDKYPRVVESLTAERYWFPAVKNPTHKVVPADAIVIERDELPKVSPPQLGYSGYVECDGETFGWIATDKYRRDALRMFAVAEYWAAHPPVDDAQVDALHDALTTAARERTHTDAWRDIATALVRDGWHKDVTP